MNFDKLIAIFDADWDESKHPRAKNGQFGKGNGGSSAPAKEKKKSTMSKSYKALSSGQKADAKANVASQIKSMSKEKQISVANRVLKAQGKELIVANKDGTYTWTNKGERVTTQKPPRIKSDKLARAIVSNGYAVPGIKTGVSAESAKVAEGIVSEMFKDPKLADRVSVDPLTKKLTPKDIKNCNLYCEGLAKSLGIKEANSRSSKLSKSEVLNKYYSIGSLIQFKMNSGKYSTYHDLLKDISSDMDKNSKRVATEIVNELGVRNVRYNGK